jgi:hypothetical protein
MASKKKKAAAAAGGAAGAARAAKNSPYVQEIVENDELRDSVVEAYEAVRSAVDRISSSKKPTKAIFDDKKLQKDLKTAADNIKNSATALREAPSGGSSKSGGGLFRKLLLVTVAAGLALALSEDLRKKVLDALFGAEEEFEYTSTTTPSTSSNGPASTPATEPTAS